MQLAAFEVIAAALAARRVRYFVVGGLAVNAHGYLHFTRDVDLVIALTPDDIRAAFAGLAEAGYGPAVPVTADAFGDAETRRSWIDEKGIQVLNFFSDRYPATPVDVSVEEPFDFDSEYARAMIGDIAPDLSVRFAAIPALVRMKEAVGRLTDLDDLQHLRWIQEDGDDGDEDDRIDWSVTTWEGSRREQLRRCRRLTVRERLEALDEMTDLAERLANCTGPTSGRSPS